MPHYWFNPQWWWICPLFMIAFFIFCMVAARRGRRAFCCPPFRGWSSPESPKDILDRRYASGDITRPEYEEKLNDIEGRQHQEERPSP